MSEIAKTPPTVHGYLTAPGMWERFQTALPAHMNGERFARIALNTFLKDPKLQKCTVDSFMKCLLDCAAFGLYPDGRIVHFIPFGDKCTMIIDYKGFVQLILGNGIVARVHADVVCEGETFEFNVGEIKRHFWDATKPRDVKKWTAVYALVEYKYGGSKAEIMSRDEVLAIRNSSHGYKSAITYKKSHPWIDNETEMAKKTAVRRLVKWVPLTQEVIAAIEADDETHEPVREMPPQSGNGRVAELLDSFGDGGPTQDDIDGNVVHETTETPKPTTAKEAK